MKEGKTGEGGKGERTDGIEEMVGKGRGKEEGRAKKGKERVIPKYVWLDPPMIGIWIFLRLNFHSKRVKHNFDTF